MLDNPEKTAQLLAALKAAAPFEVELTPAVVKQLQSERFAHADQTHHTSRICLMSAMKVALYATLSRRMNSEGSSSP